MSTNRSNHADKPVRVMVVYASGKVKQRAMRSVNGSAPWERGSGWGRAGAHALPNDGPGEAAPAVKTKNPAKVAAGKARAAQAAQRKADALAAAAKPAPVAKPAKPKAKPKAAKAVKVARVRAQSVPSSTAMVVIAFRGSKEQKKKFLKLGGGEWARKRIDAAQG